MKRKFNRDRTTRFSRVEWLAKALGIIAQEGGTRLRIERLVEKIGVTQGSFYWHFKDRHDFVVSLATYWATYSTNLVIEKVAQIRGSAKERLFAVMKIVFQEDFGRYDLAMRAWATTEPQVAAILKRVDAQRIAFTHSLFKEMGFRGRELDIRTRAFVCYLAGEHVFSLTETREEQLRQLKRRHAFFTRP